MGFLTRAQIDAARHRIAPNGFRPAQAVMDVGRRPAPSPVDVGRPIIAMRPPVEGPAKIFEDISFKEAFDIRSGQAGAVELRSDAGIFEQHVVDDTISREKSETHGLNVTVGAGLGLTAGSTFSFQNDFVLEAVHVVARATEANVDWARITINTPNGVAVGIFAALGADRLVMAGTDDVMPNRLPFVPLYLNRLSTIRVDLRATGAGAAEAQFQMLTQRTLDRSIRIQRAGA